MIDNRQTQTERNIMNQKKLDETIEGKIALISRLAGRERRFTQMGGVMISNVDHYYLHSAFDGYQLVRVTNTCGGVTNVFNIGDVDAATFIVMLDSFIAGLTAMGARL
jgi:hypothetical protein